MITKMATIAQVVAFMCLSFASAEHEAIETGVTNQDNLDLTEPVAHRELRRRGRGRGRGKRDKCRHYYCPSGWTPIDNYWKKCSGKCDLYECCYEEKKETCKDDYHCPAGYVNLGNKECRGECDEYECCKKEKKKTCKDDYHCPAGYITLGSRECRGECDEYQCCYKEKKKTCKDDYHCPSGYRNLGAKECSGECDTYECCKKEDETCSDFRCPRGWEELYGNIKCDGECDKYDCCEEKHRRRWRSDDYCKSCIE